VNYTTQASINHCTQIDDTTLGTTEPDSPTTVHIGLTHASLIELTHSAALTIDLTLVTGALYAKRKAVGP
jgi:hypothetical protein